MENLTAVVRVSCTVFSVLMRVMLAVMFAIFIALVITRYFFSYSPSWSEEVSRFLLVWISMLGAAVLVVYQDHFALHMLVQKLSPKMKLVHSLVVQMVILIVCAVVFYYGIFFAFDARDVFASGSGLSMFWPKLSIPVGMGLMIFYVLVSIVDIIRLLGGAEQSIVPPQTLFMDSTFRQTEGEATTSQQEGRST
ncbi:TRAP transporter small permease [Sulfitobacter sp. F26169L]|uniref:TRAP transporter small permease n=1 Tax=Sulfitobacter sp. F26169L TaxID=2996015 RepID=UPI0022608313|nr:TRAP transporter small permease [Sulfitobacter sp. F26169L]MCX7567959.1 TRAP transporter small permease [Sulfitobacter sp. F26169L]